jgi:hypothetical protein
MFVGALGRGRKGSMASEAHEAVVEKGNARSRRAGKGD